MDRRPIVVDDAPLASLVGTAKGLALAGIRAGYAVKIKKTVIRRVPRVLSQAEDWTATTVILMHREDGQRFLLTHNARDGWEILRRRPGWSEEMSTVTALRAILKAQEAAR